MPNQPTLAVYKAINYIHYLLKIYYPEGDNFGNRKKRQ